MTKKKWKYLTLYTLAICSFIPAVFAISCKTYDKNRPNWENVNNNGNSFSLDFTNSDNPYVILSPNNKPIINKKETMAPIKYLFGYKVIKATGNWDNYFAIKRSETQPILEKLHLKQNANKLDISAKSFVELFENTKRKLVKLNNWKEYQIDYFSIFKTREISKYFVVLNPPLTTIKNKFYRSYIDIRFFFDIVPNDPNLIKLSVQIYHDAKNHLDRRRRATKLLRKQRHDPTVSLTPLFTVEIPWKQIKNF
ncbi:hypothetical protein [Mycoplasma zalophi]|uniref:hypothetical protein n=1 Tax=Mycoplasma zalophi TaxID=191287 RepID=UPI001C10A45F|nr:hypothetical protein [Mycoplasma zalophi]MBU4691062.1 hypothetical protein [Mycoplasma zalophi]